MHFTGQNRGLRPPCGLHKPLPRIWWLAVSPMGRAQVAIYLCHGMYLSRGSRKPMHIYLVGTYLVGMYHAHHVKLKLMLACWGRKKAKNIGGEGAFSELHWSCRHRKPAIVSESTQAMYHYTVLASGGTSSRLPYLEVVAHWKVRPCSQAVKVQVQAGMERASLP